MSTAVFVCDGEHRSPHQRRVAKPKFPSLFIKVISMKAMKAIALVLIHAISCIYAAIDSGNPVIRWQNYNINLDGEYHNDWVSMSPVEALNYYTLGEVCKLWNGVENGLCKSYPEENLSDCGITWLNDGRHSDFCTNNIGSMLRYQSSKPWPESRNILDLIRMMKSNGSNTVVLIGDSITTQQLSATRCILRRFGVLAGDISFGKMSSGGPLDIIRVADPTGENNGVYFQIIMLWITPKDETDAQNIHAIIRSNMENRGVNGKVVYVVNAGAHYHPSQYKLYHDTMKVWLQMFIKEFIFRGDMVIFRETSAVHFDSNDRSFDLMSGSADPTVPTSAMLTDQTSKFVRTSPSNAFGRAILLDNNSTHLPLVDPALFTQQYCQPFNEAHQARNQNWHNLVIHKLLAEIDPQKHLGVIPFFNITRARHDYHPLPKTKGDENRDGDCRHWCGGPMIWFPVWEYVADFYYMNNDHVKIQ